MNKSITFMKRVGDSVHICRTPERLSKDVESPPLVLVLVASLDEPQEFMGAIHLYPSRVTLILRTPSEYDVGNILTKGVQLIKS